MTEYLINMVEGLPVAWQVLLMAMIPVTELRAAIPIGILMGMSPVEAFCWGVMGNVIPIVPVLLLLPWLYRCVCKIKCLNRFLAGFVARCQKKGHQVEKYGALGLLFFVAVPFPGTGVWTGCFIAFLMGINFCYAVAAIGIGTVLAGLTVTLASVVGKTVFLSNLLFRADLLGLLLIVAILSWWGYQWWRRQKCGK